MPPLSPFDGPGVLRPPSQLTSRGKPSDAHDAALLRRRAEELETAFLSEMLAHAGVGRPISAMGGGIGEERFASFLRDAQAEALVRRGGLGLAQMIFDAMMKRGGDG
jgi:Rod binding domain-containing protein